MNDDSTNIQTLQMFTVDSGQCTWFHADACSAQWTCVRTEWTRTGPCQRSILWPYGQLSHW